MSDELAKTLRDRMIENLTENLKDPARFDAARERRNTAKPATASHPPPVVKDDGSTDEDEES